MNLKRIYIPVLTFLFFLPGCSTASSEPPKVTIAAASSLTDVMEELIPSFEDEHDMGVELILGSSGKISRQIEKGAPIDVFLSADPRWINRLKSKDLVTDDTDTNFASNYMVVVSNQEQPSVTEVEDLKQINPKQKIAIGNPDSVPAGTYTKQALKKIQSWGQLQDHLVYAGHARQVLTYVESGEVDFGVVFASDALISDKVTILTEIDTSLHHPIIYKGVATSKSRTKNAAEQFLTFLTNKERTKVFEQYGFTGLHDEGGEE